MQVLEGDSSAWSGGAGGKAGPLGDADTKQGSFPGPRPETLE